MSIMLGIKGVGGKGVSGNIIFWIVTHAAVKHTFV